MKLIEPRLEPTSFMPILPNNKENPSSDSKFLYKTGTTLCGIRTDNFCIIGTDQQATLYNKGILNVKKAYKISDNLIVTGAGSSYACEAAASFLRTFYDYYEEDLELKKDITPLLEYFRAEISKIGGMEGILLLANKTINNSISNYHLYLIDGMGSASQLPLAGVGSGGDLAQGVLKEGYTEKLTVQEGLALVKKSIKTSKSIDLYSGGKSHIFVLEAHKTFELIDL